MGRLIDLDDYRNCYIGMDGEYEKWNIDPNVIAEAQPEIIRCRDCRKYRKLDCPMGITVFDAPDADGYCYKAERKKTMDKRIVMLVLCATMLISVTGCGLRHRYPKVLIDTHPTYPINEIDIGDKYEYVHFDIAETDNGKDVIIHFERRSN